jgi:hypothetical protein
LRIGEGWGHESRVKQACLSKYSKIPALDIMLKDHKGGDNLPTRPVCRSTESPNGILGDLISDYLKILADEKAAETGTEVRSTEEMCEALEEVNKKVREERKRRGENTDENNEIDNEIRIAVGSMDVSALYPSISIERAAKITEELIMSSVLELSLNVDELSTHIVSTHTQEEIDKKGLSDVCPTRRFKTGGRPGMTSHAMAGNEKQRMENQSWIPPLRSPTPVEQRKMLAMMVTHSIKYVMENHLYTTDGLIWRQVGGGAIGLRLTGELARIVMIAFDSILRQRLTSLEIQLWTYGRYVDDANTVTTVLPIGTRYVPETDSLETTPESVEEDLDIEEDLRTFKVIQNIANDIWPEIQWTMDVPSNHPNRRMPMLDLQVGLQDGEIVFEFYGKVVNTPYCIPARSAHSWKTKRSSLVQEGVRRLLNTSRNSPVERRRDIMEQWDRKMRYSGYNMKFRTKTIETAINIYKDKLIEDAKDGGKPLYRGREWNRVERDRVKEAKTKDWYRGTQPVPNLAPLILDPTSEGTMKTEMLKICTQFKETHKIGILIMERGGQKSASDIRSDPLGTKLCARPNCPICREEGSKGGCQGGGIGYQIECKLCKRDTGTIALYLGESSKSAFQRGLVHLEGLAKKKEDNVLWKHNSIHHQEKGDKSDFKMSVTGRFKGCLVRQEDEGTRIRETNAQILMNSMMQWHQPPINRVVILRGNANIDQIGAQPQVNTTVRGRGRGRRARGRGAR